MRRFGLLIVVVAALSLAGIGCSSKKTEKTAKGTAEKTGGHDDHKKSPGKHEHSGKVKENLAKLSDTDRAAAEKQMMCPVSGDHLGSMGVPIKVPVKGQDVWLCCDGCKDAIKKEPDKYLAKLKK